MPCSTFFFSLLFVAFLVDEESVSTERLWMLKVSGLREPDGWKTSVDVGELLRRGQLPTL